MVAAGADYSVAVVSDGTKWVWGGNASGQFGNGGTVSSTVPVASAGCAVAPPGAVVASMQSAALAASDRHSLAINSEGAVQGWGINDDGVLGERNDDEEDGSGKAATDGGGAGCDRSAPQPGGVEWRNGGRVGI